MFAVLATLAGSILFDPMVGIMIGLGVIAYDWLNTERSS